MRFRLTTARLIVASYGESFTPGTGALPSMLGLELDAKVTGSIPAPPPTPPNPPSPPIGKVTAALNHQLAHWVSSEYPVDPAEPKSAADAAAAAIKEAETAICALLGVLDAGHVYDIVDNSPLYRPIFDKFGNVIGHDTISWVNRDGGPMQYTITTGLRLTLFGCVVLAITKD